MYACTLPPKNPSFLQINYNPNSNLNFHIRKQKRRKYEEIHTCLDTKKNCKVQNRAMFFLLGTLQLLHCPQISLLTLDKLNHSKNLKTVGTVLAAETFSGTTGSNISQQTTPHLSSIELP
eukprot:TRINITY_DN30870_c0_g1_i1.p3 TRINITY_DN30870_c0_g1~~TRINITY_DN30870_c0_g1_i1.p3  ORF type:complete len:120 (-),score=10.44 TRINITY_DN30870_c0_g1_i1:92-451(-)